MSFVDEPTKGKKTEFKKTEFMTLNEGINAIRIVQPKAVKKWTHYLGTSYVECLGQENCPICKNNKTLQMQYPESYKDEKGYVPARRRYYVNVIDRSMGVVCPKCGKDFKGNIPANCTNCSEQLLGLVTAPINKVKVLAGGPTLFEEDLNAIDKAILDPTTKEPVGIMNYDITLVIKGSGKERSTTPIPNQVSEIDFDTSSLEMFDLDKALIKLEPMEMLSFQQGVSLKDIFAARRANQNADAVIETKSIIGESQMDAIQSKMAELFKE